VSDADTMLAYINRRPRSRTGRDPDARGCGYCVKAKALLTELGYDYVEVPLDHKVRSRVVGAIANAQDRAAGLRERHAHRRLGELERWARKAA